MSSIEPQSTIPLRGHSSSVMAKLLELEEKKRSPALLCLPKWDANQSRKRTLIQPFLESVLNHKCVKPWSQDWLIAAGAYPGFCSMKRLGVFLLPLVGMLVHRRSLPSNLLRFPNNLPVPIYTPGWREALWELSVLPKNTTQCPRPGLEPGSLDPRTSALTMRPPGASLSAPK